MESTPTPKRRLPRGKASSPVPPPSPRQRPCPRCPGRAVAASCLRGPVHVGSDAHTLGNAAPFQRCKCRLREAERPVPGGTASRGAPPLRRAPGACRQARTPAPAGRTHRHEALVLEQTLLAGRDEQAAVLHPARVQPRLLRQVAAHHAPRVGQQLYLHVAGPQLPQQAWRGARGRQPPTVAPHPSHRGRRGRPLSAGCEHPARSRSREQRGRGWALGRASPPLGGSESDNIEVCIHRAPTVCRALG